MRAVVDTNILVSALLRADSLPAGVVRGIARQVLTPVVCDAIMREYEAVLTRRRFRFAEEDVRELLILMEQEADWVDLSGLSEAIGLPDAMDWPFIATALIADCPAVTGNAKEFPVDLGVRTFSAREWVQRAMGANGERA
jgi:putative PIN family toxin of toxin-antitoxin system